MRTLLALLSLPAPALAFSGGEGAMVPTSSAATPLDAAGDHQALLSSLESKIGEIEAQIVAASEKVEVLKDTVLAGIVSKANARILHKNEMGDAFQLRRATYMLDGGVIFDREDLDGSLSKQGELVLFDGPITPGDHEIRASLVFQAGSLGVFTYVEGYKFKVESRHVFKAIDGRMNVLGIVSHDKGESDVTKDTSDRIGVRYDFEAQLPSAAPAPAPTPE